MTGTAAPAQRAGAAPRAPHGGTASPGRGEQTRARYPDDEGYVERDGVRLFYELYGSGEPTVLLLPTWSIVHSRFWKAQIPFLARSFRVLTFDGRGNGRSGRPAGAQAYSTAEFAQDALAVMDATGTEAAVLAALSCGALWGTILAAEHAERVRGIAYVCPAVNLAPNHPARDVWSFEDELPTDHEWARYNAHYWRRDYRGFLEFFFAKCLNEPHSSKQLEDCIEWALDTPPETLVDTTRGIGVPTGKVFRELCAAVRCPTLVMHGEDDLVRPLAQGAELAKATGGELVTLAGCGHMPQTRDPVRVNLLLRDFIAPPSPAGAWTRGRSRTRRALYVSSPIGLGHARRDLAIARELRGLHPDLEIEWLAQHPVTALLQEHGERIHPLSAELASESAHMLTESRGHELHCFEALRRMDEILLANFMVFLDAVQGQSYDLWIGDEAWEVDYYLHENPELKSAAYVWLTDFVGYLPMPGGGEREALLTADYNAEMIEQVERFPRVRDRALFVGEPDDIVPRDFGEGLPPIRAWTERHFDFAGYITGVARDQHVEREQLRRELGYGEQERVCVVTVGGSGVGSELIERAAASFPEASRLVPGLRMIAVAGPRIDPSSLEIPPGVELRAFVPDLDRHLAACDLALVQGGLASGMELIAGRRPFIYFPLREHFEQCLHVRHRLERHGASRSMDFDEAEPGALAAAIAQEIGREVDYRPVPTDGAARAAAMIAELL